MRVIVDVGALYNIIKMKEWSEWGGWAAEGIKLCLRKLSLTYLIFGENSRTYNIYVLKGILEIPLLVIYNMFGNFKYILVY